MKQHPIPAWALAVFPAAEGVLYAAFLTLDLLGRGQETIVLKYAGILLCLLFSLLCALRGGDRLVPAALIFTAAADWFLLVRGDHLVLGVALFLCVQAIYALRLHRMGAPVSPLLRLCLMTALLLALLPFHMFNPLNALAMLYFSQLLSNAILALRRPRARLFAAGLALFVGCDVCVGLYNAAPAVSAAYSLAAVGMWFFYLPSQALIALSALPQKEFSL